LLPHRGHAFPHLRLCLHPFQVLMQVAWAAADLGEDSGLQRQGKVAKGVVRLRQEL